MNNWENIAKSMTPSEPIPAFQSWEKLARSLKAPKKQEFGIDFGTVMGNYSVAELKDLIANKDLVMKRIGDAFNSWSKTYPGDFSAWQTAWTDLQNRYAKAHAEAETAFALAMANPLPNSMISADSTYKFVLSSLNPTWQSHSPAPGSIDDLTQQLIQMGAPLNTEGLPQPTPGNDVDLNTLNQTKQAIAQGKQVIDAAKGGVADFTKDVSKEFLPDHFWFYLAALAAFGFWILPKLSPQMVAFKAATKMIRG